MTAFLFVGLNIPNSWTMTFEGWYLFQTHYQIELVSHWNRMINAIFDIYDVCYEMIIVSILTQGIPVKDVVTYLYYHLQWLHFTVSCNDIITPVRVWFVVLLCIYKKWYSGNLAVFLRQEKLQRQPNKIRKCGTTLSS